MASARTLVLAIALGSLGCKSDQGISELKFEDIAVATGDFDYVEEALARNGIGYTPYEGYIDHAVYDDEIDPGSIQLKTETLFTAEGDDTVPEILQFDAVIVNSGTRGFGEYVYNGVEADDSLVNNPVALENIETYMARGGNLILSDWSYDLIEALWPDRVRFVNDGEGAVPGELDAAQVGASDEIIARVTDEDLASALGEDQLELAYDFSYWTVIEDVASDVDVYLRGDVSYRLPDGQGYGTFEDVPLLIGFGAGGGRVTFSTFHWRAQKNPVTDLVLLTVVDGFDPSSSGSPESTGE